MEATGRHLTAEERATLLRIVDECGPREVIGVVAQIVATQHPSAVAGDALRSALSRLALLTADDRLIDRIDLKAYFSGM